VKRAPSHGEFTIAEFIQDNGGAAGVDRFTRIRSRRRKRK